MDQRLVVLVRVASRQHGLFTRAQAREAGFTPQSIARRLEAGAWVAADYGVYRMTGMPIEWHHDLLAACLAGPAVASHRSAARLWGFPIDGADDVVEVTALRHMRRHRNDVRWHESQRLDERYVATVDRIPVTTPIRTVIDLGVVLDLEVLEEALYGAMRRRLVSVAGIERALDDLGPLRPGRKAVCAVLARARGHERVPATVLETKFLQVVRAAALPVPIAQYEVRSPDGRVIGRSDFAYPEHRLLIELDGSMWHSIGIDVASDHTREVELRERGFRMLRFSWDDVHRREAYVVETMSGELGRR